MADSALNVITICGSLRKGSFNAALARALPALASSGLSIKPAPAWEKFPVYNVDIQNSTGFPAEVTVWADAIRAADAVIVVSPEYNWSIPGGVKNAIDWVVSAEGDTVYEQASCAAIVLGRSAWRLAHAIPPAHGADHARRDLCSASRKSSSISRPKNSTRKHSNSPISRPSTWSGNSSPDLKN